MRKRLLALVLALALCMGLTVSASAAGVTDLTPSEAAAYLKALNSTSYVQYSGLEDLNGDGKPELIAACVQTLDNSEYPNLDLNIWTLRNGAAVKTATYTLSASAGSGVSNVGIARRDGQVRLYEAGANLRANSEWYTFLQMDGTTEEHSGVPDPTENDEIISPTEELSMNWDTEALFEGSGSSWHILKQGDVTDTLSSRAAQGTSTSTGSSNTYTVSGYEYDGSAYTITFETSSVEKKTLMVLDDGAFTSGREPVYATLVSVRPGSTIRVTGGTTVAADWNNSDELGVAATGGWIDGLNCSMTGQIVANILNGPASKTFPNGNEVYCLRATDSDGNPIYVRMGEEAAAVGGFTDVSANAYYADAVLWAVENGITSGTSATTFSPNNICTTAQILTFLWRANGSPAASGGNPFTDVSASAYYYQAARWAREKGLISGSAFNGDTPCTRAATVTYLWKLAGQPSAGASGFTDVPSSASYAQAVAWAVQEGITSGTSASTFSPNNTCTRAQIVTFLYRDMA